MTSARFGLPTLVGLVIANMIGAGVFTTAGFAFADLGTPDRVMLAWLIGGVVACCGAASYGALVQRMTESGGEYLFLSRAIHPAAGFVAGWVSLIAGFTGAIAFAATALEAYALPAEIRPVWMPQDALALVVVIIAGAAHARSVSLGARGQNLLVMIKLALIAGLVLYAVLAMAPGSLASFPVDAAPPNVPRALLIGTLGVTLIYLALNAIFVYGAPAGVIAGREDVAARAFTAIGGDVLGAAVRVAIVLALATSVSSMIMAGPRVYARMAADGVLPRVFRLHDDSPACAVALQVALAMIAIVGTRLQELLSYLGFTLSVSAALTVASLFVLRRREGPAAVPVPGYPWVPGLFVAATLVFAALAAVRQPAAPLAGLATIALGVMAWLIIARRHRR